MSIDMETLTHLNYIPLDTSFQSPLRGRVIPLNEKEFPITYIDRRRKYGVVTSTMCYVAKGQCAVAAMEAQGKLPFNKVRITHRRVYAYVDGREYSVPSLLDNKKGGRFLHILAKLNETP